jgi:hypothetical protein
MKRLRSKLTYANVVSTLALFLVLAGGTAFAAKQVLPKSSVGAKQLKNGSITLGKLSSATKTALAGGVGPQGPAGAPGAPGTAKAWAEIGNAGEVLRSSGGISATVYAAGVYCVAAGPFTTENSVAVATPDWSDHFVKEGDTVAIANTTAFNECPAGQFQVVTSNEKAEAVDFGFTFMIG